MLLPRNNSRYNCLFRLMVAGLLIAGLSSGSRADTRSDVESDLGRLTQQLQSAEDVFIENKGAHQDAAMALEAVRQTLLGVTARVQELEAEVLTADENLQTTRQQQGRVKVRFLEKREELSSILSAMQRLGAEPAVGVLLAPGGAEEAARAGILLDGLMTGLRTKAASLNTELAHLAELEATYQSQHKDLNVALEQLEKEQAKLSPLIAERQRLVQLRSADLIGAQARVKILSAKTNSLRELLDQLQRSEQEARQKIPVKLIPVPRINPRHGAEKTPTAWVQIPRENLVQPKLLSSRRFGKQKGALKLPVSGRTLFAYGDKRANGETVHGITLNVRRGAQVQAPVDGKILFAGPFRSYGHLLIISPAEGYHLLLAGLGSTDVQVGQWLLRGEPVGKMTEDGQQNGVFTRSKTSLYIELRKNGEPINPAPWFKSVPGKVTGS